MMLEEENCSNTISSYHAESGVYPPIDDMVDDKQNKQRITVSTSPKTAASTTTANGMFLSIYPLHSEPVLCLIDIF